MGDKPGSWDEECRDREMIVRLEEHLDAGGLTCSHCAVIHLSTTNPKEHSNSQRRVASGLPTAPFTRLLGGRYSLPGARRATIHSGTEHTGLAPNLRSEGTGGEVAPSRGAGGRAPPCKFLYPQNQKQGGPVGESSIWYRFRKKGDRRITASLSFLKIPFTV